MNFVNLKKTLASNWFNVFLFILLIVTDQVTKFYANRVFLNSVFAFSLPLPLPVIYLIYFCVIFFIVRHLLAHYKNFSYLQRLFWLLVLSGAVSNILERIFFGYVRDWIYISSGIFNLADFYIILGIILLFVKQYNEKNENY
jgi:lipoprotein signal peptidase